MLTVSHPHSMTQVLEPGLARKAGALMGQDEEQDLRHGTESLAKWPGCTHRGMSKQREEQTKPHQPAVPFLMPASGWHITAARACPSSL